MGGKGQVKRGFCGLGWGICLGNGIVDIWMFADH